MNDQTKNAYQVGAIISADLTVPNAAEVLAFYQAVIGWGTEGLTMQDEQGTYTDHVIKDGAGQWVGGICWRRGMNADLPPVWLVYIQVTNIAQSLERCLALGGQVLKRSHLEDGSLQYAVIQDPVGAILALTRES
jgi:predicted enzyme related to lactoylglutathione lyase